MPTAAISFLSEREIYTKGYVMVEKQFTALSHIAGFAGDWSIPSKNFTIK